MLVVLSIYFWYITLPIFAFLVIISIFINYQKKSKLYRTLDTKDKQEIFLKETRTLPTENGKITKEYKTWLIQQQEKEKELDLQKTMLQPSSSYQKEIKLMAPLTPPYQPETVEKKIIEKPYPISFDLKDFKVKFRDYTPNEKIIRVFFEFLGIVLLIIFSILIILSIMQQSYSYMIIYIVLIIVFLIPNEIIEHKLRKRVRIRKMEIFKESTYQPSPSYQLKPRYPPERKDTPEPRKVKKVGIMFCPFCGGELLRTDKTCKHCGSVLD